MNFYTFDNTNKKINVDGKYLYDFFEKTMVNNEDLIYSEYTVPSEFDTRLDLVCKFLYGDSDKMEELMTQNGILNPFSIKTDDVLKYSYSSDDLNALYQKDIDDNTENMSKILNVNLNKTSTNNTQLPPSINPGLKSVSVDYSSKKITIINKFR